MKKLLLLLTFLTTSAFAWDQRSPLPPQACAVHSPWGWAQTARPAQPICREAYFVAYDAPVRIPVYVSYTLLPQNRFVTETALFIENLNVNTGDNITVNTYITNSEGTCKSFNWNLCRDDYS